MIRQKVKVDVPGESSYTIHIGDDLLNATGAWARKCLGPAAVKISIVSNQTVAALYGEQVSQSLSAAGYSVSTCLIGDGEKYKSFKTAESVLKFLSKEKLSRADAVVALGGGVVGDLAGFASAIYLRGISFLQIPTTLLSMIDSSVGGKTGVNSEFGKNLIGAFHQPRGVFIDTSTLNTLPTREVTAGFCEAVKQGAISGNKLLDQTGDFLSSYPPDAFAKPVHRPQFRKTIADLIAAHLAYKAQIVAGDERESSKRTDGKSRKILNFGHTLGHALEKATDYKYLRHGEAVGYGILFAAELSKSLALCGEKDVKLLNDVVHRLGPLPVLAHVDEKEVFEAFKFDKKHLSGSLQMVLIKGIGKPIIVNEKDIPRATARRVLKSLLQKWA